ncbi:MAG: hypothetical protein AAGA30_17970, partial [Planctomycetota bacterium]
MNETCLKICFVCGIALILQLIVGQVFGEELSHDNAPDDLVWFVDTQVVQSAYQEIVDHFSDDSRAMSPRSWSTLHLNDRNTPMPPTVSFGESDASFGSGPLLPTDSRNTNRSPFRKAISSTSKESPEYFESRPLMPNAPNAEKGFWFDFFGNPTGPSPQEQLNSSSDILVDKRANAKDNIESQQSVIEGKDYLSHEPSYSEQGQHSGAFSQTPYAQESTGTSIS